MPKPDEATQEVQAEAPAEAPVATNVPAEGAPAEPEETEEDATDDEPEAPAPSTVHVNAAAGFTEEDAKAGAEEHGEFFIGMWGDKPNYGCPYCFYASIEGSGDIELHILSKIDSGDIVHRAFLPLPEGA